MKSGKIGSNKQALPLSDVMKWCSVDSIVRTFNMLGFKDTNKIDAKHTAIAFATDPTVVLQVIETDKNAQAHLKDINNRTRYLLLADSDYQNFTFVKQAFTAAGTPKPLKFRFSKSGNLEPVVTKLRSHLTPGNPSALDNLFDMKEVVKSFYRQYKILLTKVEQSIAGISNSRECRHYAELILYRLMFCYFIQTRHFISNDPLYFNHMLTKNATRNFYKDFLCDLFFNVLNTKKGDRDTSNEFYNDIPFLNGGLFRRHTVEEKNSGISIPNTTFEDIFKFLNEWAWYADDDEEFNVNGVNPEILGHIFEQTLTDRPKKGAYYTPIDVTNFITRSAIKSYCIDRVNDEFGSDYNAVSDILKDPEHATYLYFHVLCPITVLDNACGSGEFLLSASKVLAELYSDVWDAIENGSTPAIVHERGQILESSSKKHYFQRKIITNNLYGVDMEEEAIEICKLRLWLSLISGVDQNSVEPLPNIDYNIVAGNSLTGYTSLPSNYQQDLDGDVSLLKKIGAIDKLKRSFNSETNPIKVKVISDEINLLLSDLTSTLNKLRINELGLQRNTKSHSQRTSVFAQNESFHYILGFGDVVNNRGGFDIIIGNPPYVEQRNLDYPTSFFHLFSCKNTYAYFFEVSLKLLKTGGWLGYIVPVSSVSTKRMTPLQDFLLESSSELKISNYDDRPGRLFEGLEHCRSSIVLCKKSSAKCTTYTTGYARWYTDQRQGVFANLDYVESSTYKTTTTIPKLGNPIELDIMDKLLLKNPLESYILPKSPYYILYHDAPLYWIRGMDFQPTFVRDGKIAQSVDLKQICLKNNTAKVVTLSVLNSSLFYWYFIKVSDCRHLILSDIKSFPCSIDDLSSAAIAKLNHINKRLMASYQKNSRIKNVRMTHGNRTYQEFKPNMSKQIIDEIDKILAPHYNFTTKELKYIQQFDLSYRMGDQF